MSVKSREQGAAGSSTTSCDRDRVRELQGGTRESTWGWEYRDTVTWAECLSPPQCPCAPSPHPCPVPPSWETAYSSFPAWSAPKASSHLVHHEAQPQQPSLPQTLVSCPNWDGGGGCCHSISSNHLDWRAWSPALASQGGLQHSMSPAGTAQRDKGWGREAPRTPSYLGLPQPTAGATGSKRLCKGAGDTAEAKNPAKTGRGVQLHPGSILPPHAGGPGQSSPSPSPLHADPTAKG